MNERCSFCGGTGYLREGNMMGAHQKGLYSPPDSVNCNQCGGSGWRTTYSKTSPQSNLSDDSDSLVDRLASLIGKFILILLIPGRYLIAVIGLLLIFMGIGDLFFGGGKRDS